MKDARRFTPAPVALVPFAASDDPMRRGSKVLAALFVECRSPHTRRAYAEDFRLFRAFLQTGYGRPVSPAQAVDLFLFGGGDGQPHVGHAHELAGYFEAALRAKGNAPATINRRVTFLRLLVRTARRLGLVTWTLERRSLPIERRRDTSGPALADVGALLAVLAADGRPMARRDYAIIRLLFDVALRRGEVAAMNVSDVDLQAARVRIRGKGRAEPEWLSVPEATVKALAAWLAFRRLTAGPLFCLMTVRGQLRGGRLTGAGIYRMVVTRGRAFGLRLRPHGFRHSAITTAVVEAAAQGIDVTEVLQYSRHRSLDTLMIYRDRTRNVQGAVAGLVAAAADTSEWPVRAGKKGGAR